MKIPGDADPTKSVCSGILRRLLCSGTLPTQTHPSDAAESRHHQMLLQNLDHQLTAHPKNAVREKQATAAAAASSGPGVVARLMGLESFPDAAKDDAHVHTTLGALLRSRSVNSIDFLLHFDPAHKKQPPQHRRVRTSVSFRHGLLLGDDSECVELGKVSKTAGCDDDYYRKRERESKSRRAKGEDLQLKTAAAKRVEVRKRSHVKDFQTTRLVRSKEEQDRDSKCTTMKKRNNKVLPNQGSRRRSNSLKKVHPQGSVPEVARRRVRARKSPLLLSENGIFHDPYEGASIIGSGGHTENKKIRGDRQGRSRMVDEICRATEEDVKENWDSGMEVSKLEDVDDICQQFGQEILHALMKQLVHELVVLYTTREIEFLDYASYHF